MAIPDKRASDSSDQHALCSQISSLIFYTFQAPHVKLETRLLLAVVIWPL